MTTTRSELAEVERQLVGWLPAQRWFGGKQTAVRSARLLPIAEFTDQLSVGGPRGLLTLAEVQVGEELQTYQLPIGVRPAAEAVPGSQTIAVVNGLWYYDATTDDALVGELLALISANGVRDRVRFRREPSSGLALVLRRGLPTRLVGAEQSNTSIVIGERFILKLYRRIRFGLNPDLELHRELDRAGTEHIAPLLGAIEGSLGDVPMTLGMLQSFCVDSTDGWRAATENIDTLRAGATSDGFDSEAHSLGRAVAAVHADLARRMGTVELAAPQLAEIGKGFQHRLAAALRTSPVLEDIGEPLRALLGNVAATSMTASAHVQRVHGDLHLGQALRTSTRWVIIDFEGEPAAPVADRVVPHSPLRDVAGMLRSFDYAAHHRLAIEPGGDDRIERQWLAAVRDAFCRGYAVIAGADPREHGALLAGYELDKALYELSYETANRPAWVPIPLGAIRRMAGVSW